MNAERSTTRQSRIWLTLTVNLTLVAVALLLLRSNRSLTREQLAEVRVGMSLQDAHRLLGPSRGLDDHVMEFGPVRILSTAQEGSSTVMGRVVTGGMRFIPRNAFHSTIEIPQETNEILVRLDLPPREGRMWLGHDHLLWVQVDAQKVIQYVCILTYREDGGGALAWMKHQYDRWFSKPVGTAPALPMPAPATSNAGP